jgi:bacillithiol biosynthesis cysteine-adding enzyme BshC
MTSRKISYSAMPQSVGGFTKLFNDYVNDFGKVQRFYESDFHSDASFLSRAEDLAKRYIHRERVSAILAEQNRALGASDKTIEQLRNFGSGNTFAVVTGQQVGILGGPLYTIYKTVTAVALAKRLNAAYPQYNFVPVFWLEGEDHDFDEVKSAGLLNQEGAPVKVEYLIGGKPLEKNIGAVGEIVLDSSLEPFFDQLQRTLPPTEFRDAVVAELRQAYAPPASFGKAFALLMNRYFADDGLIFISANDPSLKKLLSPIFQMEIEDFPKVSQLVIQRSAELEEGYHAQIKTKALNLFMFHKEGRYLIEPRENDFSLKGTRHFISKEELLRIAAETPEVLSPNVALRPICQDVLLPTVAYVAGPSEIAYYAQLKGVYEHFGMKMPVIYPRASATIVEEKVNRVVEKFGLDVIDFLHNPEGVQRKVVEMVSEIKVDEMFQDAAKRTNELLNEMKFGLNYIDSTLMGPLDATREKIGSQLDILREKVSQAQEKKHEVALRQLGKASHLLFPNNNFQERELNLVYFTTKYGPDFLRQLREVLQPDPLSHQIISL